MKIKVKQCHMLVLEGLSSGPIPTTCNNKNYQKEHCGYEEGDILEVVAFDYSHVYNCKCFKCKIGHDSFVEIPRVSADIVNDDYNRLHNIRIKEVTDGEDGEIRVQIKKFVFWFTVKTFIYDMFTRRLAAEDANRLIVELNLGDVCVGKIKDNKGLLTDQIDAYRRERKLKRKIAISDIFAMAKKKKRV